MLIHALGGVRPQVQADGLEWTRLFRHGETDEQLVGKLPAPPGVGDVRLVNGPEHVDRLLRISFVPRNLV